MALASRVTATPPIGRPRPAGVTVVRLSGTPPDPHGRAGTAETTRPVRIADATRRPATFPGHVAQDEPLAHAGVGPVASALLESEVGVLPARSGVRQNPQATDPHPLEAVSEPEPQAVGDSGSKGIVGVGIAIPTGPKPIALCVHRR